MKRFPDSDHAVIIGGGIAGLLSARVVSEYYGKCTVIETDKLSETPAPRKGAIQTTQPHILFARGYRIIQDLLPGISSDLAESGAIKIDWAREFCRFDRIRGWNATARTPSEIISVTCTRPLLETCIRRQVAAIANVEFLDGHHVTGLVSNADKTKIMGVCLRSKDNTTEKEIPANLVIDAGGRFSQALKWIEALGLDVPEETVVEPLLGYATRRYRPPQGYMDGWKAILIAQMPPDDKRLGYLAQVEDGEWIATVGGFGGDFPATDNQGFLEFAQSLPDPKIYDAIKEAQPVSPVYAYRATANRMRHYEKIQLPIGFISIGDAVCALCPVYGQGITQSAQSTLVLRDWLRRSQNRFFRQSLEPVRFQEKLANSNASYWSMAAGQDLSFSTTKRFPPVPEKPEKEPGWLGKLMRRYSLLLLKSTSVDPDLNTLLMKIVHQIQSPLIFFYPTTILRVLKAAKKT